MTACAIETAPQSDRTTRSTRPDTTPGPAPGGAVRSGAERAGGGAAAQRGPAALTLTADGSYAARLAVCRATGERFPERWTLSGPEPYAVSLPARQPEEAESEVLPLADGRVLIRRRVAERHALSLLYPTGPGTGELRLGFIECGELSLLPPAPCGTLAYALAPGEHSTHVWLVHGGSFGPEHVAEVPGRCTAGSWLDRTGRLLALDRELGGRVKSVVVDLHRGGETTPLLQITEDSDDRLVLADPDSGLLLVRSNAPGRDRLGWGVLGSELPVRFPDCLDPRPFDPRTGGTAHPAVTLAPFAAQPGQTLTPENCAVAFRLTPAHPGGGASWVAVWRPAERRLRHVSPPSGWLPGTGLWTREGELHLPYATTQTTCGLARLRATDLAPNPPARRQPPPAGPPAARPTAPTTGVREGPGQRDGVGGRERAGGRAGVWTGPAGRGEPGARGGPGTWDGAGAGHLPRGGPAAWGGPAVTEDARPVARGHSLATHEATLFRAPLPAYEAPLPAHERCADPHGHPAAGHLGAPAPLDTTRRWHEGPAPHHEPPTTWHPAPHHAASPAPRPVPLQQAPLDGVA
ncbi:hypothetical protein [Streptomyces sp. NPDC057702]|uniref:hypothetical protein n=1 Tax=unclassified Streptomyces TaxID=2593676 RepID=UPI0036BA354E